MKDLSALVDKTKEAKAVGSGTPWKERIVNYLLDQKGYRAPIKKVLEVTDEKYDPNKYRARKHCLDSQKTYMKQDLLVHASYDGEDMVLVGLEDKKTGKVHPFK
jgi:hypothetical protein